MSCTSATRLLGGGRTCSDEAEVEETPSLLPAEILPEEALTFPASVITRMLLAFGGSEKGRGPFLSLELLLLLLSIVLVSMTILLFHAAISNNRRWSLFCSLITLQTFCIKFTTHFSLGASKARPSSLSVNGNTVLMSRGFVMHICCRITSSLWQIISSLISFVGSAQKYSNVLSSSSSPIAKRTPRKTAFELSDLVTMSPIFSLQSKSFSRILI
mmetsp:Transcript_10447/g.14397  ORF Transcript_10447/g.14397 Transcript_10447/m.14397 type:complete len:215 (-) Transcript_10447:620-1264(-)